MAEKKGFFRKIFSFGTDSEQARTPEGDGMPKAADTEVGRQTSPDPDARPVAAAHSVADTEAGAAVDDGGGIVPLKERAEQNRADDGKAPDAEAEKKTPNS